MNPPGNRSRLDRILALVGEDAPSLSDSKVTAFRRFMLLAVAVELWELLPYWADKPLYRVHVAVAALSIVCCLLGWFPRWARAATAGMLLLMLSDHALAFPLNANHQYLGMICLGLLWFLNCDLAEERDLVLKSLRWLVVIGMFYSGLQKLLYGYYFHGEFLAYAISRNASFAEFFKYVMPAAEIERLRALEFGANAGPYRVDAPLFVIISNMTYLLEMLLPFFLLIPRTRRLAMAGVAVLVIAIELGARELFFGAIMVNMLALYSRGDLNRRLLPGFAILYLYVLAMALGLLPKWYFS